MTTILLAFLAVLTSSFSKVEIDTDHAIYVSVLEISYKGDGKGQLKLKLFADDLEDAIFNHIAKRYDLLKGDCNSANEAILNYLDRHLVLIIDDDPKKLRFIGCELNDISLWTSFEFTAASEWERVAVKADYLMELFPTQSNVVSITHGDQKQMFRLVKGDIERTISF